MLGFGHQGTPLVSQGFPMRLPEDLSKYHADYQERGRGGGWLFLGLAICVAGIVASVVGVVVALVS